MVLTGANEVTGDTEGVANGGRDGSGYGTCALCLDSVGAEHISLPCPCAAVFHTTCTAAMWQTSEAWREKCPACNSTFSRRAVATDTRATINQLAQRYRLLNRGGS